MSILIKGMEMPKNCCECPVNANVCNRGYKYLLEHPELYDKRSNDCPIIELPPHGRLIDADALKVDDGWLVATREQFNHIQFVYANAIANSPTIIESEGEDG